MITEALTAILIGVGLMYLLFWLLGFGLHLYFNRQWGLKVAFWLFNDDAVENKLLTNRWWGYIIAWLLGPVVVAFQVLSEPDEDMMDTTEVDISELDEEDK